MKLSFRLLTALAAIGGVSTLLLGHQSAHSQITPRVVASYSVLCDLTEQIAQDTVDVTCLIEAGEDPHIYSATPSDRRAIGFAHLVLYGGYGFEPNIIQMAESTHGNTPLIAVSEVAVTEPLLGEAHDHGSHRDRGHHGHGHHGHGHNDHGEKGMSPDPHVWHDAENGIAIVRVIQEELSVLSPENAEVYQANAETLIAQLTQLDSWIQQQVATVPESQRVLVTTHDALGYYADAYGIRIEAALESFSTEARPSAADLRELIDLVEDSNIPTVFIESTSNPGLIEAVSRETDIGISDEPLYADSLGEAGTPAGTYTGMLMTNTCTIVTGLGGRCNEAAVQAFLD
ncbi:periplasmic solute binding protein [Leptolyngbya sp. Heron Island J]|uniref:metal ABC transporter solute-binding protein, Zn/Mn family n=1 Tax=Leptolyngbya sp. Heron Island J TaxID=1385935 RepID=UPI0003B96512|nr:zinc ABC transporter substrate-binding protein [Leptolyngbya sp. Heron Island J]ESA33248.1 periplasmic solute binding protein [Leptolyngbya sp. Heron Island J]